MRRRPDEIIFDSGELVTGRPFIIQWVLAGGGSLRSHSSDPTARSLIGLRYLYASLDFFLISFSDVASKGSLDVYIFVCTHLAVFIYSFFFLLLILLATTIPFRA